MKKENTAVKQQKSSTKSKKIDSAQRSVPYTRVYDDKNMNGGIIEIKNGEFSKSYFIEDANYSDVGEERQDEGLCHKTTYGNPSQAN